MDITVVGRGQEHVNSTFPQLMLYQALGWQPPQFAHFPLILGPDREKLSKRKHPEADVMLHARTGILPEALNNFVVRLGWSHGNDEVISREQMVEWFGFDHVGSTSGVWNPEKLTWLNQHYIKTLPPKVIAERVVPFLAEKGVTTEATPKLERMVEIFRERAKTLVEMAEKCAPYFSNDMVMDEKAAIKHLTEAARPLLARARAGFADVANWHAHDIDVVVGKVAEEEKVGMGKVAQPIRVAVTGGTVSPGIGETLELIGKEEALKRLDAALNRIG
jgi:glutamyl-tRNA synthetase